MKDLTDWMPFPWEQREVVAEMDGHEVVTVVTPHDFALEGFLLAHCLGTKNVPEFLQNHRIFSVRDKNGVPHCTILYTFNREHSEYGKSDDFAASLPGVWKGKGMHLLQVRGRVDDLARVEYHRIARAVHRHVMKGDIEIPDVHLDRWCIGMGDRDTIYHRGYRIDVSKNIHNPNFWRERKSLASKPVQR